MGIGGWYLDILLSRLSFLSLFSVSLVMVRYRLKYCLKEPFNSETTNQQKSESMGKYFTKLSHL